MPRRKEREFNIGAILKAARINMGMTQEEIAQKMGVTQSYIYQLENDKKPVTYDALIEIAEILQKCPKGFVQCKKSVGFNCKYCTTECQKCVKNL